MLSWKLPRQLSINQVPQVFREQGILFGYRHPRSSATDCLLSVFQMTNETLNIWTHFLPAWYFLWKLFALAYSLDVWNDTYAWPFLAYMLTCCIYPFTSSCAHTFSTMSIQARHICYFFDYGALSMYSLGSAIAYSTYVFPEEWINSTFHHCYVPIAVLNTVISTGLSCYSRFSEIQQPRLSKTLRTLAFAYPYLFDSTPLFYRLYLCTGESCMESVIPVHYKHCVFAFLTCFIFAAHLPERLAPGCFDYIAIPQPTRVERYPRGLPERYAVRWSPGSFPRGLRRSYPVPPESPLRCAAPLGPGLLPPGLVHPPGACALLSASPWRRSWSVTLRHAIRVAWRRSPNGAL
ncbi:hypothetical protein KIL84_014420 [Mauremys mutica]|uniref:Membrane progestin receptor gamma n=1 Tax=Mauremys mutica TaxID=74926 RepID=A0A9D3XLQ4_9SAUR|nr:hypothetical protein KIL84_014420 [Mauremys mutica]